MQKEPFIFFYPNLKKVILLLILILLMTLVKSNINYLTKTIWTADRGYPLAYLSIKGYIKIPCPPIQFCVREIIKAVYLVPLFVDLLIGYAISCMLAFFVDLRFYQFPK